MKTLFTIIAIAIVVFCGLFITAQQTQAALFRTTLPQAGGTGTSTAPTADDILIGGDNARYDVKKLTAGSNISIATTSGAVTISSLGGGFGQVWELITNAFSQSALAPTTTQNIHVSGTGTSTFSGGLEVWRQIATPYLHATSSTASQFNNATSTLFSATTAWLTNVITGGDTINEFAGTGLTVTGNALTADLGTAIEKGELANSGVLSFDWVDSEIADTLTIGGSSSVTWGALTSYPMGCTNQFVRTIGDTLTCETVANTDLANSSVSYGGVSVSLGGSDATPAFNLTDAINYPISSLALAKGNFLVGDDAGNAQATSTIFISSTGNVGIGTTSPQTKLHILGADGSIDTFPTIGAKDFLVVENNGNANVVLIASTTSNSGFKFQDSGAPSWVGIMNYSHTNDALWFGTNGTEKVRIDSSGNVGIGTTTPDRLLTISDSVGVSESVFLKVEDTEGTGEQQNEVKVGLLSAGSGNVFPGVWFGTSTPDFTNYAFLSDPAGIDAGSIFNTPSNTLMQFRVANSTKVVMDSSGNVGIGTTTPAEILHIAGSANNNYIQFDSQSLWRKNLIGVEGADNIAIAADDSNAGGSSEIRFRVDGTQRMVINSSGNVGIGTTNPAGGLHIQGLESGDGQLILDATTTVVPQLLLKDGTKDIAVPDGQVLQIGEWNETSDTFTENMRITGNGNVGIGTTGPNTKLEVAGIIRAGGSTTNDSSEISFLAGGGRDAFYSSGSGAGIYLSDINTGSVPFDQIGSMIFQTRPDAANRDFAFVTGTTPSVKLLIEEGGNIGIGTTTPVNKLDVDVDASFGTGLRVTGTSVPAIIFESTESPNTSAYRFQVRGGSVRAFKIVDDTNNIDRLVFNEGSGVQDAYFPNSNVGIGTTSPFAKLAVNPVAGDSRAFVIGSSTATNLEFNLDQKALLIGGGSSVNTVSPLQIFNNGFTEAAIVSNDSGGNPSLVLYKSRGTNASPTIVSNGDFVGSFFARGYDGDSYNNVAGVRFAIDGTPGNGDTPGRITFNTSADGTSNFAERMRITSSGNVGIGTTNPGSRLEVENTASANDVLLLQDSSGTCEAQPTTTGLTWSCSSDERLKELITPATKAVLEEIVNIPLYEYTVKATGERTLGVVAQRLLGTPYEYLVTKREDDFYTVSEFTPWQIVKAIQELYQTVTGNQEKIQELEERIEMLEKMIK